MVQELQPRVFDKPTIIFPVDVYLNIFTKVWTCIQQHNTKTVKMNNIQCVFDNMINLVSYLALIFKFFLDLVKFVVCFLIFFTFNVLLFKFWLVVFFLLFRRETLQKLFSELSSKSNIKIILTICFLYSLLFLRHSSAFAFSSKSLFLKPSLKRIISKIINSFINKPTRSWRSKSVGMCSTLFIIVPIWCACCSLRDLSSSLLTSVRRAMSLRALMLAMRFHAGRRLITLALLRISSSCLLSSRRRAASRSARRLLECTAAGRVQI